MSTSSPTSSLLRKPAEIFLLLGLLFGVAGAVFIPYGGGFDEEQHLARIIELSNYVWLPNTSLDGAIYLPPQVLSLSYQRRYFLEPASDLLGEKFSQRNDRDNPLVFTTRSIYNPIVFLPQAFIARWFWQKYDYPFIPIVILCRLAGLFIYLAGSYLAIRVIPIGKWALTVLALAPMALFQAATLNADGFTHAAAFLFIAFAVEFLLNPAQPTRRWTIWGFAAALLVLGLAKSGGMLLLPLLFFLPYRRFSSRAWPWIILAAALLSVGLNVGWEQISIPTSHYGEGGEQGFSAQLASIRSHWPDFAHSFVAEITSQITTYYRNWVASYGHWVGIVPEAVFWLFPLLLICAALIDTPHPDFTLPKRLMVGGVSLFAGLMTALFFFGLLYEPGTSGSYGRQGRYFIVTMPLLLIAFSAVTHLPARVEKSLRSMALLLLVLVLGLFGFGLYATYYTYCASTYYTFESCVQPVYKQIDLDSAPAVSVHSSTAITQTFSSVCGPVEGIRVRALDIPAGMEGTLTLSLFDSTGALLAATNISANSIQSRQYLELDVPQPSEINGAQYAVQITASDIQLARPFPLLAAPADYYRDGSLFIDGHEQESDLIFKYLCSSAWKR